MLFILGPITVSCILSNPSAIRLDDQERPLGAQQHH